MSVFVQMIFSKLTNILLSNLVLWRIIMSQSIMQKVWFAIFKVNVTVTARACITREYDYFYYTFRTFGTIVTKLGLIVQHKKPEWAVEKLDYCIQGQGHSIGSKCQCLSRWYFLNCYRFCYQTWYCDASPCAALSCKKIGLLFSRSKSEQRLIWSKYNRFYSVFLTADPFATNLVWL